jgi:hypothetical protein
VGLLIVGRGESLLVYERREQQVQGFLVTILPDGCFGAIGTKAGLAPVESLERPAMAVADIFAATALALSGRGRAEKTAALDLLAGDQALFKILNSLPEAEIARASHPGSVLSVLDAGLQAQDQSAIAEDMGHPTACVTGVAVGVDGGSLGRAEVEISTPYCLDVRAGVLVESIATVGIPAGLRLGRVRYVRRTGRQGGTLEKVFEEVADLCEHVYSPHLLENSNRQQRPRSLSTVSATKNKTKTDTIAKAIPKARDRTALMRPSIFSKRPPAIMFSCHSLSLVSFVNARYDEPMSPAMILR